jgi:hypothetical protein
MPQAIETMAEGDCLTMFKESIVTADKLQMYLV